MNKYLLLSISLLLSLLTHAQQAKVARINIWYDTTAVAELYDRVPLGLELVYADSSSRQTTGLLRGNLRWNKIQVSSSNGSIQNGVLYFNRLQLVKDRYRITITVNREGNTPLSNTLTLPYLVGMRFNHYTDSIKRNIRYYMNVEGKFSSGRVLPLDTVQLRFRTSAGAVIGQDVLVEQNDTAKAVLMEAWYKPNPDLYIRSEVPIKIMPDPDLPPPAKQPGSRGRRQ
ncbi:hypothetical protein SAMN04488128_101345 [Chitinophaga eiseniae]|uniref:Uncharacterized protein n=1 Tax=Chitinophaga eiseniae TaxID=634771 RepID=A0A1T4KWQ5_9BACT|nr:hypothetical protein [Chitinophaga eiseniae]SJZ46851.1 hypothetical protein SAMN04488128_101345 [Chitinophaga eiseniae]